MFFYFKDILQLFKFKNWRIRFFLMSRMSYQTLRLWTAFVKCLPCQCLAFYLGTSGSNSQIVKWSFYAMVFSVGGDFCLVFPDHFITGILLFALAQVCFIRGFGFTPLRWEIEDKYCTRVIITLDLYTFYPLFNVQKRFSIFWKFWHYVWLVF